MFDAAIALFVERGFEETSMDDVAARANLARSTVFNHFPRKVVFLEEWTLRRRLGAADTLSHADLSGRSARTLLDAYFGALAELNVETRAETTSIFPPAVKHTDLFVDHPLARDLADLVEDTDTALDPPATPLQVGRLLALGYFSAVMRWIEVDPPPFGLAAELSAVVDVVLDGAFAGDGTKRVRPW